MTLQTCFEAIYGTNPLPCQNIMVFGSSLILWSLWGSKSPISLRHPLRHPVATIPGPWPCDPSFPQCTPAPLRWRIVQPDKPKTVGKKTQMFINLRPHIWLNISRKCIIVAMDSGKYLEPVQAKIGTAQDTSQLILRIAGQRALYMGHFPWLC